MEHEVIDITPEKDLREALEEARKTNKVLNEMFRDVSKQVEHLTEMLDDRGEDIEALKRDKERIIIERDMYRRVYNELVEKVIRSASS